MSSSPGAVEDPLCKGAGVEGSKSSHWHSGGLDVGGRHRVFSLKIGVKPSEIVLSPAWCSRLRPTTGVHPAPCHDEFSGPRSDYARQVALATTTP
ncbi:hypothetical protein TNCV_4172981 [Trichonephila clavipes]|nr:hypothetical protein TNCV_4172981 [Trichonephila clavipes]